MIEVRSALETSMGDAHHRDTAAVGLFVNHRGEQCGVYQFGRRLFDALAGDGSLSWHYVECADGKELLDAQAKVSPDAILVNYHPETLAWAATADMASVNAPVFSVFHEAHQRAVDALAPRPFDFLLCPDPTLVPRNPIALPVPRFAPPMHDDKVAEPDMFTVGSFGFATPGKGFVRLCSLVNDEFDEAIIRLNLPFHDNAAMVPESVLSELVAACEAEVTKPGVELQITHRFFSELELLQFLASNTINAFLYEGGEERGISSCTDYALSAGRPIAISRSPMFRHLHGINPSICVEDRSLRAIAEMGTAPLRHYRQIYDQALAGRAWNRSILWALRARTRSQSVPDGRGFNKRLDDRSRTAYVEALADLGRFAPDVLARKIPEANIQQAFALDAAQRLAKEYPEPRILAVGSYEDTAVAALRAKGYAITEIDPNVNALDLEAFYCSNTSVLQSFDMILSVSVLEHVPDDAMFVRMIADFLSPGGVAILTVDFSETYPEHGRKPSADCRLYTTSDLRERLMVVLPDCALLDTASWDDGADDFEYEGCLYSFASFVFRKLPPDEMRYAPPLSLAGGAAWRDVIGELQAAVMREVQLRQHIQGEHDALTGHKAVLELEHADLLQSWDAFLHTLRLDAGPRAIRAVLPLARMLRGIGRLKP
jgi:SAM-dependent methyltransferase